MKSVRKELQALENDMQMRLGQIRKQLDEIEED